MLRYLNGFSDLVKIPLVKDDTFNLELSQQPFFSIVTGGRGLEGMVIGCTVGCSWGEGPSLPSKSFLLRVRGLYLRLLFHFPRKTNSVQRVSCKTSAHSY